MPRRLDRLDAEHLERLAAERPVAVLATADRHGRPHCALVSWLVAQAPDRLVVALDRRGQGFRNLAENTRVALQVLGNDLVLSVGGTAEVVAERLDTSPFETAKVMVWVDEVTDQAVAGVRFQAPSYRFEEAWAHRAEVERRVLEELAGAYGHPVRIVVLADETVPDLDD